MNQTETSHKPVLTPVNIWANFYFTHNVVPRLR